MSQHRANLVKYRIDSANQKLHSAKVLLDAGEYKDSIGRSYYAIFLSVRAILARDGVDFGKHSGVIGYFQKEYIKSGLIEVRYSKYLSGAFQIRNLCDYEDFYVAYREDAEEQYTNASEFVAMVIEFCKSICENNKELF